MKKSVFVFVLLCGFVFSVFGQSSGFKAKEEFGKITIIGYEGSSKDIVIPDEVNGMPIIAIGEKAFDSKALTSVTIGNNVTKIGKNAFYKNQLTSITIPKSVTFIGQYAFSANQLTSVTMSGNSTTQLEAYAFGGDRLTSITIGSNVRIDKRAFGDIGFEAYYNGVGDKQSGTYSRSDNKTNNWTKGVFSF